jgi:hypothetical protein
MSHLLYIISLVGEGLVALLLFFIIDFIFALYLMISLKYKVIIYISF